MKIKTLWPYGALLLVMLLLYTGASALAVSPTPDCEGTIRAWQADVSLKQYMSTHKCYCPSPNVAPVCTPKSTPSSGTVPSMGGYGSSEDFAIQMFGSLFGSLLQGILAPPQPDTSYQQQLIKQQIEKQKQEALKKKQAMERWKKLREEEEARAAQEEARKRQRGRELLSKMQGIGKERLEPFGLETKELKVQPISTGIYDTSGYTSWQRMLCAAYFSSKALEAQRIGDMEGAVFMNSQADRVSAGEMTEVECRLPALAQIGDIQRQSLKENSRLTEMARLLPQIQQKLKSLQQIEMRLNDVKAQKIEAKKKLREAEEKLEKAKTQKMSAQSPEEEAEADDLLQQALALKEEAQAQVEKAKQAEKEYTRMKESEMQKLEGMQKKITTVSSEQ